jgi:hypothetical protein
MIMQHPLQKYLTDYCSLEDLVVYRAPVKLSLQFENNSVYYKYAPEDKIKMIISKRY